jgi:exopolyphosphatase/guanosine-5'-triphosphate,3'-diphosphate pyrophosphatase
VRIAAIDIGSNSVHMIIVEARPDLSYEILDREKDMIKLGAGAFRTARLSPAAFDAGLATLRKFRKLADRHGAQHIVACATSAVRSAENGDAFLAAVRRETGIQAQSISGDEEARLIYLAVRGVIDLTDRRALIIDIGGGSVEALVADEHELVAATSLELGVLRLRDLVANDGPLARDDRRRLEAHIRERAAPFIRRALDIGFDLVVGTSGTILDLGLAVHRLRSADRWRSPDGRVVHAEDLRDLADRLLGMDAEERGAVSGIDEHRADTIHLGALLLVTLLEQARKDELVLCDVSIREGLVLDYLARHRPPGDAAAPLRPPDIRRDSVIALLRRCEQDGPHAARVAELALQIFDQTRSIHQFSTAERRILEFAALLHDVGRRLSFEQHEYHAYYLIRHGDLRGFREEEIELIALVARYHRRARPKPRHREYAALRPRSRRVVRVLAGILRIAEGLERGHAQVVRYVRCDASAARLRIVAHVRGDAELEIWAARRKSPLLAQALDRPVEIESEEERGDAYE